MQSAWTSGVLPWILGLSLLSLLGILVLLRGFYPRRAGTTPYCRKCNYNLTGTDREAEDARCPECGSHVHNNAAVVIGERVRCWRRVMLGSLVFLIGAVPVTAIAVGAARGVDWYQYKPTTWVIRDIRSSNLPRAQRAWQEIQRRRTIAPLSDRYRSQLIEVCLDEQKCPAERGTLSQELLEEFGARYAAGETNAAQAKRFFENAVQVISFDVRPKVIPGQKCPYRVITRQRLPWSGFYAWKTLQTLTLDGEPCGGGSSHGSPGWSDRNSMGTYIPELDAAPGPHELALDFEVAVYRSSAERFTGVAPLFRRVHHLTCAFEAFNQAPADFIRSVASPELDATIVNSTRIVKLIITPAQGGLERRAGVILTFERMLPIGLACDVLLESDGHVIGRGQVTQSPGNPNQCSDHIDVVLPDSDETLESIDVRLRRNTTIAMDTVDLFEIWDGELLFQRVKTTLSKEGISWSSNDPGYKPTLVQAAPHRESEAAVTSAPSTPDRDEDETP